MLPMILATMLAGATPAANTATFRIADVEFTLPIPAGYCLPTGKAAAALAMTSAADKDNVSLINLVQCGDADATRPDYYMLKAPISTLATTTDRDAFLAALTNALALPRFNTEKGMVDNVAIGKSIGDVTGQDTAITGTIKPLGHDDICGYLGGVLALNSTAISYRRSVSLCLTAIGGKVIGITRYSDGATSSNVMRHFASARDLALGIKAVAKP